MGDILFISMYYSLRSKRKSNIKQWASLTPAKMYICIWFYNFWMRMEQYKNFLKNQWKEFTKWKGAIDFFRNSYVVYWRRKNSKTIYIYTFFRELSSFFYIRFSIFHFNQTYILINNIYPLEAQKLSIPHKNLLSSNY